MKRNTLIVLYVLAFVALIVGVDILFLRHLFWERLIVNIAIVTAAVFVYLKFLHNRI